MRYYRAVQPAHLNGLWHYASFTRNTFGPACGCELDQGHDTREEAERHFYDTQVAVMTPVAQLTDDVEACSRCQALTTRFVSGTTRMFRLVAVPVCDECIPDEDREGLKALLVAQVPFVPRLEFFG